MDTTTKRVRGLIASMVRHAYGTATPVEVRVCGCGHEDGAHHGHDGELRCGEPGCECEGFQEAYRGVLNDA